MDSSSSKSSVEDRILRYSQTYQQLFPVKLDIEKVWEISVLQADSILHDSHGSADTVQLLSRHLFDTSASLWTRAISGASLVKHYCCQKEESVAVEELFYLLSNDQENASSGGVTSAERSNNDTVMISMYSLCLLRRIHQRDLLTSFLDRCMLLLEDYIGKSSTSVPNSSWKMCLSVISILLSRGTVLNISLHEVVEEGSIKLLERFYALFYIKNLSTNVSREQIAKRLISPLLQLMGNSEAVTGNSDTKIAGLIIDITWSHCSRLAEKTDGDLQTCTILLCVIMSMPQFHTMGILGKKSLWDVLSSCFLSSDTVVRKRAAFIMQLVPNTASAAAYPDDPLTCNESRKKKEKKQKPPKSRKNSVEVLEKVDTPVASIVPTFLSPPMLLNSMSGLRCWWGDFLDIYGQIEGCTSMHLVDQIWPQLEHLCRLAATADNSDHSEIKESVVQESDGFVYPVLSFVWVKALLHILLQISIPGIRKAVFRRILQGGGVDGNGFTLSPSRQTISWFCYELLPIVDSVGFFSAYFISQGVDVGCRGDNIFLEDCKINVLAHPGILMPSFISRLLRSLSNIDQSNGDKIYDDSMSKTSLVGELVQSIIHVVCGENGLHSLSAAKWILRAFAEPSVLALIGPCLDSLHLREMRAFLRGRLACSNGVVREHVLQGLLPLFLRGIDACKVSLHDVLETVKGSSCFGLDRIVNHSVSFSSLRAVVLNCCAAQLAGRGVGCPLREVEASSLALAYAIVADSSTREADQTLQGVFSSSRANTSGDGENPLLDVLAALEKICLEHSTIAGQLYRSPYLDRKRQQLVAVDFLKGVAQSVVLAVNRPQGVLTDLCLSGEGQSLCRMFFPLLPEIYKSSCDISSYLSLAIIASLTAAASESDIVHTDSNVSLLIDSVTLLDDCTSILGALLLVPKILNSSVPSFDRGDATAVVKSVTKTLDGLFSLLQCDPSPLSNVLTVRCACTLLCSVQSSWPLHPSVTDTEELIVSVSRLTSSLITIMEPSSSVFREFVTKSDLFGSENEGHGSPLLIAMARLNDCQFGRVSTAFIEQKWAGIRAGLDVLVLTNISQAGILSLYGTYSRDKVDPSIRQDHIVFSQAIDQLSCCSMESLPDILSCCLVVARQLCLSNETDGSQVDRREELIVRLLDTAWINANGGCYTDVRAINSFIRLAFDASILKSVRHFEIRRVYDKVEEIGLMNRPHIMQSLVCALCAAWTTDPVLSLPFFPLLPRLLVYREPKQDDHNIPDNTGHESACVGTTCESDVQSGNTPVDNDVGVLAGVCRFSVLTFLELCGDTLLASQSEEVSATSLITDLQKQQNKQFAECLHNLIEELIAMNSREDFIQAAMIGSDLYGQKLRCWQSLCVLSKYMTSDLLQIILESYFTILTHSAGHSIRVHVELFGAAMSIKFPEVMMPRLLLALREFNHSQQTLCSVFVILGHAVLDKSETISVSKGLEPKMGVVVDIESAKAVVSHLLPWIACSGGLPRTVAQLLMHSLIPVVLDSMNGSPSSEANSVCGQAYLQCILQYLELNRDASKGMPKMRNFFCDLNPERHCSVKGLALLGLDNTGEVVAPHILTFLADTLKEEVEIERERERLRVKLLNPTALLATESSTAAVMMATLQTKRVPFDELQLSLESEVLTRQQNAAGRKRQEVVVCASLIDKVTNLAGIARTCEIFAVQELVLANLGVVQTDTFQGIAVSCDQWLPMSEVPVHALTTYLQSMRRKGFTILGLEQTDNSMNLGESTELPSKCVLLLGREKEGIPVELLQEIDCCVEIPQYGVIRSLNVHVSAALAIWEITKLNHAFLDGDNMSKLID